jgi:hypothetical protein
MHCHVAALATSIVLVRYSTTGGRLSQALIPQKNKPLYSTKENIGLIRMR